jgi:polysaccharide pyruvyl transferase WcaK-like protein
MKIALWNASGLDNLGDRALDLVNRRELAKRIPDVRFETFCPWPGSDTRQLTIRSDGYWEDGDCFDAIIVGGGAVLIGPPFRHPGLQFFFFGTRPRQFRGPKTRIWNAVCSDTEFMAPLRDDWRQFVKDGAAAVSYCSVRNGRTKEFLLACGVTNEIVVVPDPAVALFRARGRQTFRKDRLKVGVSVAQPKFPRRFIELMRASALSMQSSWSPLVTLIDSANADSNSKDIDFTTKWQVAALKLNNSFDVEVTGFPAFYGDKESAKQVVARASCLRFIDLNTDGESIEWMKQLDILVAGRLHHCVIAFALGIPVVAVDPYYSNIVGTSKLREFMCEINKMEHYFSLWSLFDGNVDLGTVIDDAFRQSGNLSDIRNVTLRAISEHFDRIVRNISG